MFGLAVASPRALVRRYCIMDTIGTYWAPTLDGIRQARHRAMSSCSIRWPGLSRDQSRALAERKVMHTDSSR